jgi:hypothetical protein
LSYPISHYISRAENKNRLISHTIPAEGELVGNPEIDTPIKKAFDFQPGYIASLVSENGIAEDWEVFKDALGQSYIYSKTTGAVAYFINNGVMFYFTSFYGSKKSLLYNFYLAAYKVVFSNNEGMPITDKLPLSETVNKFSLWLQDVIAPFYGFININYNNYNLVNKNGVSITSKIHTEIAGKKNEEAELSVYVDHGNLISFSINSNGKNITAKWGTKN